MLDAVPASPVVVRDDGEDQPGNLGGAGSPDRRDGRVYLCSPKLVLAVKVAIATGRPLLLSGDPGSGKSSLAAFLAQRLGWRYFEHVFTSRTQASDLLWVSDPVRRLADAQVRSGADLDMREYVDPGVLWWAFHPESASRRGCEPSRRAPRLPNAEMNAHRSRAASVVLLDEIDKADPDVPNALLVPLGSMEFTVADTGDLIRFSDHGAAERVLVVITTNGERDLPPAFVRRCVTFRLTAPDLEQLVEIAKAHAIAGGSPLGDREVEVVKAIADRIIDLRPERPGIGERVPGAAEFLDAVRACLTLDIAVDGQDWAAVEQLTLRKDT